MISNLFGRVLRYRPKFVRLCSSTPDIDIDYYCNEKNIDEIRRNINTRKGLGDIDCVLNAYKNLKATSETDGSYKEHKNDLLKYLICLPNQTHPIVQEYEEIPCLIREINEKRDFGEHSPLEFSEITKRLNLVRTAKLGHTCGHKSYYFLSELAELEEALIKYTVISLLNKNFKLVSVPDILPSNVLQSCGMTINSDRTQVKLCSKYC